MVFMLFGLIVLLAVVLPVVVFAIVRATPRIPGATDRITVSAATSPELDARLTRIEEAIDAMAVEIERLRAQDLDASPAPRQISGSRDDPEAN